jgi:hypothetical protein
MITAAAKAMSTTPASHTAMNARNGVCGDTSIAMDARTKTAMNERNVVAARAAVSALYSKDIVHLARYGLTRVAACRVPRAQPASLTVLPSPALEPASLVPASGGALSKVTSSGISGVDDDVAPNRSIASVYEWPACAGNVSFDARSAPLSWSHASSTPHESLT